MPPWKKRHSPTSMQNFSTMKRTMWGGNTFMWGCMPIVSNSFMKGAHQLISVFVVTPAESANCCFVIAFIKSLISTLDQRSLCTFRSKNSNLSFGDRVTAK